MKDLKTELVNAIVAVYHQGRRSLQPGRLSSCAYRGADGCKCIVGFMIDDAAYTPELEGFDTTASRVKKALIASGFSSDDLEANIELLVDIQGAHDVAVTHFKEEMLQHVKFFAPSIYDDVMAVINATPA